MSLNSRVAYDASPTVTDAIETRRSLRAFLPRVVADQLLRKMLSSAARAPSGTNMQPWQVYVVKNQSRQQLCDAVCDAFDNESELHQGEQPYYPAKWFEPYLSRRRKVGWDLYNLLGIVKGDRDRMQAQHRRNFEFFDAPIGMIFTLHRDLATGSWLDYGMYLQNIMLLAREAGLHTCPQAAWADYHQVIRSILPISADETVVCGMAMGYADPQAVENTLLTERAEISQTVRFFGQ